MNRKKSNLKFRALIILVLSLTCLLRTTMPVSAQNAAATTITNLRVQSLVTPLAVEDRKPVFSWKMNSAVIGQKQSAYLKKRIKQLYGTVKK